MSQASQAPQVSQASLTKNQFFEKFYISRLQIYVEFCRNPAPADFFSKILKKSLQNNLFCRLFPIFHDFLHFCRIFSSYNSILCKFADKIMKNFKFCQHQQIHNYYSQASTVTYYILFVMQHGQIPFFNLRMKHVMSLLGHRLS